MSSLNFQLINNKNTQTNPTKKQQGFTLIEVLVAIAIFASLSIAAFQVLNQAQRSNQQSLDKTKRIQEVQRAVFIMDADFRQIAAREFKHEGKPSEGAFLFSDEQLLDSDDKGILFLRDGWLNPQFQLPRGEVLKVGYRLQNEHLERVWWRHPDTPAGEAPLIRPLLSKVLSLDFRFYNGKSWGNDWSESDLLPEAIEVNFELEDYGKIQRIYFIHHDEEEQAEEESDSLGFLSSPQHSTDMLNTQKNQVRV